MAPDLLRRAARPLLAAALAALPAAAWCDLYVCTVGGRTLTADQPPNECQNARIRVLNPDGSVKRVIEPPETPEQKKAREQEEKQRREREKQAQEQMRKDRALLETYASEDEIETSRDRTLAQRAALIERANQQLKEFKMDRKRLEDEKEFYVNRPMPDKLKRALDDNTALQAQQLQAIEDIRADMRRINERYDAELQRFRELVMRGATPVQRKGEPESAAAGH